MRGFTLIELIVVLAVLITLLAFTYPSLIGSQHRTTLTETINLLVQDLKDQQLKAMLGDLQGGSTMTNYGIYFQANQYVLFSGTTYVATASANFPVSLNASSSFTSIPFPNSQIVFSRGSGEVLNFSNNTYTLTITDSVENVTKNITVNKYGIVTQIN